MKLKATSLYIISFVLLIIIHFGIWEIYVKDHEEIFFKYYLFLSAIFIFVMVVLTVGKKYYPGFIGFIFMGLLLFKLAIMFLVMQKLGLSEVPNYKMHFIFPYLATLLLETLFAVSLIKDEKNQ